MTNRNKKITSYDVMLKKHIDKKDLVKIYRVFNNEESNISGFILKMTKDFFLIQVETDFLLDGFTIIRKDQFDSLRCNKFDRFSKKILKSEGIFDNNYGIDKNISLSNWQDIFKDLKKYDFHVIADCEGLDKPDFIIGPIKKITRTSVGIQYYNPLGQLEEKFTLVKFKDITTLKFDDRYSTTYRKYLTAKKVNG